ncbi:hypothetical protein LRR18_17015, partial [Mangrovimonas sp. AS39]|uniref:hypothetical protein n=1 Tax=Mangrovimonas futianensis TaxID=2895523 RepID=UPI001E52C4B7
SKDWELATTDTVTKYLNKLEVDYGRKCSKMLKKLEEDRLLIEISRLAEGVKLPSGVKGKKSKPIPKKEDFDILL